MLLAIEGPQGQVTNGKTPPAVKGCDGKGAESAVLISYAGSALSVLHQVFHLKAFGQKLNSCAQTDAVGSMKLPC